MLTTALLMPTHVYCPLLSTTVYYCVLLMLYSCSALCPLLRTPATLCLTHQRTPATLTLFSRSALCSALHCPRSAPHSAPLCHQPCPHLYTPPPATAQHQPANTGLHQPATAIFSCDLYFFHTILREKGLGRLAAAKNPTQNQGKVTDKSAPTRLKFQKNAQKTGEKGPKTPP